MKKSKLPVYPSNVRSEIQTAIDTITDDLQYMTFQDDHIVISRQLDLNIYG